MQCHTIVLDTTRRSVPGTRSIYVRQQPRYTERDKRIGVLSYTVGLLIVMVAYPDTVKETNE